MKLLGLLFPGVLMVACSTEEAIPATNRLSEGQSCMIFAMHTGLCADNLVCRDSYCIDPTRAYEACKPGGSANSECRCEKHPKPFQPVVSGITSGSTLEDYARSCSVPSGKTGACCQESETQCSCYYGKAEWLCFKGSAANSCDCGWKYDYPSASGCTPANGSTCCQKASGYCTCGVGIACTGADKVVASCQTAPGQPGCPQAASTSGFGAPGTRVTTCRAPQ